MTFHILIVDDEYPIRKWLVHTIRENRPLFFVDSASNGQEALEKLSASSFDLVITDIKMPHIDGLELLKNISSSFSGIGAIVLSSYDDYDYVRNTFKYDAADYLLKTEIDTDKFLDTIDNFFQTKSSAESRRLFSQEIRRLLNEENTSPEVLSSLLASFQEYTPRSPYFFVLLKQQTEDTTKPYFPATEETMFRFSIPWTEHIHIACIEIPCQPSLLSQLQLQTVYIKHLQKYNRLSLLLYSGILSSQDRFLAELHLILSCQELDFYGIDVYGPVSFHEQKLKLEEQYLSIRKAILKSDREAVLSQTPKLLEYAKSILYADIDELKFMCLKIYESVYISSPFYDLTEYCCHIQRFSSLIVSSKNWDALRNVFLERLTELYRQTIESSGNLSPPDRAGHIYHRAALYGACKPGKYCLGAAYKSRISLPKF